MTLYSQRNTPPPTELRYDVPGNLRCRVVAIIEHYVGIGEKRAQPVFLQKLEDLLRRRYGGLARPVYEMGRQSNIPVIEHFLSCHDERALDFVEACFRLGEYCGGQEAVDEINQAFREEGVGYELTRCIAGPQVPGAGRSGGPPVPEDKYPRIIRIDNQRMFVDVVAPVLALLSHPGLSVANAEMLKAHAALRAGDVEDAITLCGSAFESVLKTICDVKAWRYDPDRDTFAKLIGIGRENGLFPPFYAPILEAVGTMRNKLGDAHGRGPKPQHHVTQAHAEHMIHVASAHMLFIARLAGLS